MRYRPTREIERALDGIAEDCKHAWDVAASALPAVAYQSQARRD